MNRALRTFLFLFTFLYGSELLIISDYDYTNQNFTFNQTSNFIKSWPVNRMDSNQIHIIYAAARKYQLHVLVPITRASCEKDVIENYQKKNYLRSMDMAMGYGHSEQFKRTINGMTYYKFGGFETQINKGCALKRRTFDMFTPGSKRVLLDIKKVIYPKNAATYSLYWYTPYYGRHRHYQGILLMGNKLFELKYNYYVDIWERLNEKNGK